MHVSTFSPSPWPSPAGRGGIAASFSKLRVLVFTFVVCAFEPTAHAAAGISETRVREITAMLSANPAGLGQAATNRLAWDKLARRAAFASVVSEAQKLAAEPVPELTDDLYLDYSRTGNRDRCQAVLFARNERLSTLTLAECLEDQGRFIKPIAATIAAMCAERTWVYPAHDGALNNFYGRTVEIDLRATHVAWELATADFLLGDKFPADTRRMIRENLKRRVFQPYHDMVEGRREGMFWLRATHNWNAVCLAGVTGSALALEESPEERAWFIAAAEFYIRNFLKGFTPDGYCSEGLGYWNYGFGHFTMLGETVRQATAGGVDLLANPAALAPALFPPRSEIINGVWPIIADCWPGSKPGDKISRYLAERLGLPVTGKREDVFCRPDRSLASTALYAFLPDPLPVAQRAPRTEDSPLRTWFTNAGVLICRPAPKSKTKFAVALKGGHNAEHHNHNDVGSFSVVLGKTMVLCDPGAEVYTRRTFSPQRYESKVLNSFGHAVPVVAGQLQRTGADARAVVLRTKFTDQADTLVLDIRSAYGVPELQKLERMFVFRRASTTSLTVRDEVAFTEPKSFTSALVTWGQWKQVSKNELLVSDGDAAVRVKIETGGLPFTVSAETLDEDVHSPAKPVRIGIALSSPVRVAEVTLAISPARAKADEPAGKATKK